MPVSPMMIDHGRLMVQDFAPASVVARPSYSAFRTVLRMVSDGSKSL